jgi:hypothetical protein
LIRLFREPGPGVNIFALHVFDLPLKERQRFRDLRILAELAPHFITAYSRWLHELYTNAVVDPKNRTPQEATEKDHAVAIPRAPESEACLSRWDSDCGRWVPQFHSASASRNSSKRPIFAFGVNQKVASSSPVW